MFPTSYGLLESILSSEALIDTSNVATLPSSGNVSFNLVYGHTPCWSSHCSCKSSRVSVHPLCLLLAHLREYLNGVNSSLWLLEYWDMLWLELVDLALCELLYLAAQLLLQKFFLSNLMFLSYSDLALVASLPQQSQINWTCVRCLA